MLFMVHMRVSPPVDEKGLQAFETAKEAERSYAMDLQERGVWRQLWRIAGLYENFSLFEVDSVEELHDLLENLPLRRWIDLSIHPLVRHPSRIDPL